MLAIHPHDPIVHWEMRLAATALEAEHDGIIGVFKIQEGA